MKRKSKHLQSAILFSVGARFLVNCLLSERISAAEPTPQFQTGVTVPAISAPVLAGQPIGTRLTGACALDSAPANSPIEVQLPNLAGQAIQVPSVLGRIATGTAADGPSWINIPPEGNGQIIASAANFGFSGLKSPGGAVVGVFLGDDPPNPTPRPPDLDFTGGLRDLVVLQPLLQQPFYIGNGRTSDSVIKSFVVPERATRLFLGVQDFIGCYSPNTGSFTLTVTALPRDDVIPLKSNQPGDTFSVPAISSPVLAGQSAGTRSNGKCALDSAPSNSPIEVQLPKLPRQAIQVPSVLGRIATGTATDGLSWINIPPEGNGQIITSDGSFGLSRLTAPGGAVVGVFLGDDSPNPSLRPPDLDFSGGLLELAVLQPLLQQLFCIGNGRTAGNELKSYVVPEGATRLLLGVQDYSSCYSPNTGSFTVTVTALSRDDPNPPGPVQPGDILAVPAIAALGLAGQPAGARLNGACSLDSAPFDSPVEVQLPNLPDQAIQVTNVVGRVATGTVADGPNWISIPPEGNNQTVPLAASFGLSGLKAPGGALVGVFLGNDPPNPRQQPPDLDFSGGLRELAEFKPLLQQPFYIGNGRTAAGSVKTFLVPDGATRLCLGVQDQNGCYSPNTGSFTLKLIAFPRIETEPPDPGEPFQVPGIWAIGLAGQPDGAHLNGACALDSAPLNSPVAVPLPKLTAQVIQVTSVSGVVAVGAAADGPAWVNIPPAGNSQIISSVGVLGLSALNAPGGALVGVFLGDAPPNPSLWPPDLDFSGGLRELAVLQPLLQQSFYIGNGRTTDGQIKRYVVPAEATRLFLGVQDYNGCYLPNTGAFTVTIATLDSDIVHLFDPVRNGNAFSVSLVGKSGSNYALEYKKALTDPSWITLPGKTGSGGVTTLTDFPVSDRQRFYRGVRLD